MVQAPVATSWRSSQTSGIMPWPGDASTRQYTSSGWPGWSAEFSELAGSRHHSRLMTQCSRMARTV